jgi:hypothetical protein
MNRALLEQLRRLADDRCDYCRMSRRLDPLPFQVDHIIADSTVDERCSRIWH